MKSPLKFAGGKSWLVPRLSTLFNPTIYRLVEPFLGGASVALGLSPQRALVADTNKHLVNFWQCVQRGLGASERPMMINDATVYYRVRERFNNLVLTGEPTGCSMYVEEMAWLFWYLNRTCFNGLLRFNSKGFYNVPFGKYKTIIYRENFDDVTPVIKDWKILHADFRVFMAVTKLTTIDFIYADPPYDDSFTDYSAGGFSWSDQEDLVQLLRRHPGPVVASNKATPRITELYRDYGFEVELVDAPRRISCNGDRNSIKEIIATRNCIEVGK